MGYLQLSLILLVVLLHLVFMILEMVLWEKESGRAIFRTTREFAASTRALAMNQGLYNGFLAAGLLWGLWLGNDGMPVLIFFLGCVIIAGLFGAATINRRIFLIQAAPGIAALVSLLL